MSRALFPHHDWADADGLPSPDAELAATGYFRNDPDSHSKRLRHWHQVLWSKESDRGGRLSLQPEGYGLRDLVHNVFLKSDAAVPVWERYREVKGLLSETELLIGARDLGSIHDLGWRLYDMGGMVLFPGAQLTRGLWTINQAKGCTRLLIADRLDLTLECIRVYYEFLRNDSGQGSDLPNGYDLVNPLGSVLHRYRSFFEIFGSFDGYVGFWLLDDLVVEGEAGLRVDLLLPRATPDAYDFQREVALPSDADQYCAYLVAADEFIAKRNRRMAREAHRLGHDVCPKCLDDSGEAHHRWTRGESDGSR
ncbi:MAG: hypothetical protein WCJ42_11050 [Actinomycetes bacterium]